MASERSPFYATLPAAIVLSLLLSASADAQTSADRASARLLATRADEKVAAKDYAAAADLFSQAYRFVHAPTLRLEQAHAELKLGRLIDAQDHLLEASRVPTQPGEPASWSAARQTAATEASKVAPRIASIEVQVTATTGVKTTVTIDDRPLDAGTEAVPHAVDPGPHKVAVSARGCAPVNQKLTLAEGERNQVKLALPSTCLPPVAVAVVPVTPVVPVVVAPASVAPAQPPPPAEPASARPGHPGPMIAGFVVGGAGLATGIVTGLVSLSKVNDIKPHCIADVCPTKYEGEASNAKTLGTVSTVSFIVAGVGALTGVVFIPYARSKPGGSNVAWSIGPGTITAWGTF